MSKKKKPVKATTVFMRVSSEARKKILNWMFINRLRRPAEALDHMLRLYTTGEK